MILDKKTIQFFSSNLPASASKTIQNNLKKRGVNISQQLVYKILKGERSDNNNVADEAWKLLYEHSKKHTKHLERILAQTQKQIGLIEKLEKTIPEVKKFNQRLDGAK